MYCFGRNNNQPDSLGYDDLCSTAAPLRIPGSCTYPSNTIFNIYNPRIIERRLDAYDPSIRAWNTEDNLGGLLEAGLNPTLRIFIDPMIDPNEWPVGAVLGTDVYNYCHVATDICCDNSTGQLVTDLPGCQNQPNPYIGFQLSDTSFPATINNFGTRVQSSCGEPFVFAGFFGDTVDDYYYTLLVQYRTPSYGNENEAEQIKIELTTPLPYCDIDEAETINSGTYIHEVCDENGTEPYGKPCTQNSDCGSGGECVPWKYKIYIAIDFNHRISGERITAFALNQPDGSGFSTVDELFNLYKDPDGVCYDYKDSTNQYNNINAHWYYNNLIPYENWQNTFSVDDDIPEDNANKGFYPHTTHPNGGAFSDPDEGNVETALGGLTFIYDVSYDVGCEDPNAVGDRYQNPCNFETHEGVCQSHGWTQNTAAEYTTVLDEEECTEGTWHGGLCFTTLGEYTDPEGNTTDVLGTSNCCCKYAACTNFYANNYYCKWENYVGDWSSNNAGNVEYDAIPVWNLYTDGAEGLGVPNSYNSNGWNDILETIANFGSSINENVCPGSNVPSYIISSEPLCNTAITINQCNDVNAVNYYCLTVDCLDIECGNVNQSCADCSPYWLEPGEGGTNADCDYGVTALMYTTFGGELDLGGNELVDEPVDDSVLGWIGGKGKLSILLDNTQPVESFFMDIKWRNGGNHGGGFDFGDGDPDHNYLVCSDAEVGSVPKCSSGDYQIIEKNTSITEAMNFSVTEMSPGTNDAYYRLYVFPEGDSLIPKVDVSYTCPVGVQNAAGEEISSDTVCDPENPGGADGSCGFYTSSGLPVCNCDSSYSTREIFKILYDNGSTDSNFYDASNLEIYPGEDLYFNIIEIRYDGNELATQCDDGGCGITTEFTIPSTYIHCSGHPLVPEGTAGVTDWTSQPVFDDCNRCGGNNIQDSNGSCSGDNLNSCCDCNQSADIMCDGACSPSTWSGGVAPGVEPVTQLYADDCFTSLGCTNGDGEITHTASGLTIDCQDYCTDTEKTPHNQQACNENMSIDGVQYNTSDGAAAYGPTFNCQCECGGRIQRPDESYWYNKEVDDCTICNGLNTSTGGYCLCNNTCSNGCTSDLGETECNLTGGQYIASYIAGNDTDCFGDCKQYTIDGTSNNNIFPSEGGVDIPSYSSPAGNALTNDCGICIGGNVSNNHQIQDTGTLNSNQLDLSNGLVGGVHKDLISLTGASGDYAFYTSAAQNGINYNITYTTGGTSSLGQTYDVIVQKDCSDDDTIEDCTGTCGGSHKLDNCNVCVGTDIDNSLTTDDCGRCPNHVSAGGRDSYAINTCTGCMDVDANNYAKQGGTFDGIKNNPDSTGADCYDPSTQTNVCVNEGGNCTYTSLDVLFVNDASNIGEHASNNERIHVGNTYNINWTPQDLSSSENENVIIKLIRQNDSAQWTLVTTEDSGSYQWTTSTFDYNTYSNGLDNNNFKILVYKEENNLVQGVVTNLTLTEATLGCTDLSAFDYNETANVDDGSCDYDGCMDPCATNYNSSATIDDGCDACIYVTPTIESLINVPTDPYIDPGTEITFTLGLQDINNDGSIDVNDGYCGLDESVVWSITGGQTITEDDSNQKIATTTIDTAGTYTVTATVNNTAGLNVSDDLFCRTSYRALQSDTSATRNITINTSPTVTLSTDNASPLNENDSIVTVTATGADSDDNELSYSWETTGGAPVPTLTTDNNIATFSVPPVAIDASLADRTFGVKVVVNDGLEDGSDTLEFVVNPYEEGCWQSGADNTTTNLNLCAESHVTCVDNDTCTFTSYAPSTTYSFAGDSLEPGETITFNATGATPWPSSYGANSPSDYGGDYTDLTNDICHKLIVSAATTTTSYFPSGCNTGTGDTAVDTDYTFDVGNDVTQIQLSYTNNATTSPTTTISIGSLSACLDSNAINTATYGNTACTDNCVMGQVGDNCCCFYQPLAPVNLTASSDEEKQITLNWDAVTLDENGVTFGDQVTDGTVTYDIYDNSDNSLIVSTNSTTYTHTGLGYSTSKTYYLKARYTNSQWGSEIISDSSSTISGSTPAGQPPTIDTTYTTNVVGTDLIDDTITATSTDPNGFALSSFILYSVDGETETQVATDDDSDGSLSHTFAANAVDNLTTYDWKLISTDEASETATEEFTINAYPIGCTHESASNQNDDSTAGLGLGLSTTCNNGTANDCCNFPINNLSISISDDCPSDRNNPSNGCGYSITLDWDDIPIQQGHFTIIYSFDDFNTFAPLAMPLASNSSYTIPKTNATIFNDETYNSTVYFKINHNNNGVGANSSVVSVYIDGKPIDACSDGEACNYDSRCVDNDYECYDIDNCVNPDCAGECDGTNVGPNFTNQCGTCIGPNTDYQIIADVTDATTNHAVGQETTRLELTTSTSDSTQRIVYITEGMDCTGTCEGETLIDPCGVCGGDSAFSVVNDCTDLSDMDTCSQAPTYTYSGAYGCAGVCYGGGTLDQCGICNGNNNGDGNQQDCAGVCWGGSSTEDDACGECTNEDNKHTCAVDMISADGQLYCSDTPVGATFDCHGVCGGDSTIDDCSQCACESGLCGPSGYENSNIYAHNFTSCESGLSLNANTLYDAYDSIQPAGTNGQGTLGMFDNCCICSNDTTEWIDGEVVPLTYPANISAASGVTFSHGSSTDCFNQCFGPKIVQNISHPTAFSDESCPDYCTWDGSSCTYTTSCCNHDGFDDCYECGTPETTTAYAGVCDCAAQAWGTNVLDICGYCTGNNNCNSSLTQLVVDLDGSLVSDDTLNICTEGNNVTGDNFDFCGVCHTPFTTSDWTTGETPDSHLGNDTSAAYWNDTCKVFIKISDNLTYDVDTETGSFDVTIDNSSFIQRTIGTIFIRFETNANITINNIDANTGIFPTNSFGNDYSTTITDNSILLENGTIGNTSGEIVLFKVNFTKNLSGVGKLNFDLSGGNKSYILTSGGSDWADSAISWDQNVYDIRMGCTDFMMLECTGICGEAFGGPDCGSGFDGQPYIEEEGVPIPTLGCYDTGAIEDGSCIYPTVEFSSFIYDGITDTAIADIPDLINPINQNLNDNGGITNLTDYSYKISVNDDNLLKEEFKQITVIPSGDVFIGYSGYDDNGTSLHDNLNFSDSSIGINIFTASDGNNFPWFDAGTYSEHAFPKDGTYTINLQWPSLPLQSTYSREAIVTDTFDFVFAKSGCMLDSATGCDFSYHQFATLDCSGEGGTDYSCCQNADINGTCCTFEEQSGTCDDVSCNICNLTTDTTSGSDTWLYCQVWYQDTDSDGYGCWDTETKRCPTDNSDTGNPPTGSYWRRYGETYDIQHIEYTENSCICAEPSISDPYCPTSGNNQGFCIPTSDNTEETLDITDGNYAGNHCFLCPNETHTIWHCPSDLKTGYSDKAECEEDLTNSCASVYWYCPLDNKGGYWSVSNCESDEDNICTEYSPCQLSTECSEGYILEDGSLALDNGVANWNNHLDCTDSYGFDGTCFATRNEFGWYWTYNTGFGAHKVCDHCINGLTGKIIDDVQDYCQNCIDSPTFRTHNKFYCPAFYCDDSIEVGYQYQYQCNNGDNTCSSAETNCDTQYNWNGNYSFYGTHGIGTDLWVCDDNLLATGYDGDITLVDINTSSYGGVYTFDAKAFPVINQTECSEFCTTGQCRPAGFLECESLEPACSGSVQCKRWFDCVDCAGVPNGTSVFDDCNVCGGTANTSQGQIPGVTDWEGAGGVWCNYGTDDDINMFENVCQQDDGTILTDVECTTAGEQSNCESLQSCISNPYYMTSNGLRCDCTCANLNPTIISFDDVALLTDNLTQEGCCSPSSKFELYPDLDLIDALDDFTLDALTDYVSQNATGETVMPDGSTLVQSITSCNTRSIPVIIDNNYGTNGLCFLPDGTISLDYSDFATCDAAWTTPTWCAWPLSDGQSGCPFYISTDDCVGAVDDCGVCVPFLDGGSCEGDVYHDICMDSYNVNTDCSGECPADTDGDGLPGPLDSDTNLLDLTTGPNRIDICNVCHNPVCEAGEYWQLWNEQQDNVCVDGYRPGYAQWNQSCVTCGSVNATACKSVCDTDETFVIECSSCDNGVCNSGECGDYGNVCIERYPENCYDFSYPSPKIDCDSRILGNDNGYRNDCCHYEAFELQALEYTTDINAMVIVSNFVPNTFPYLSWKYCNPIQSTFEIFRNNLYRCFDGGGTQTETACNNPFIQDICDDGHMCGFVSAGLQNTEYDSRGYHCRNGSTGELVMSQPCNQSDGVAIRDTEGRTCAELYDSGTCELTCEYDYEDLYNQPYDTTPEGDTYLSYFVRTYSASLEKVESGYMGYSCDDGTRCNPSIEYPCLPGQSCTFPSTPVKEDDSVFIDYRVPSFSITAPENQSEYIAKDDINIEIEYSGIPPEIISSVTNFDLVGIHRRLRPTDEIWNPVGDPYQDGVSWQDITDTATVLIDETGTGNATFVENYTNIAYPTTNPFNTDYREYEYTIEYPPGSEDYLVSDSIIARVKSVQGCFAGGSCDCNTCFDLCDGCAEQVPDDTGNIPTPESCYEIFNSSNSEIPFPYYKGFYNPNANYDYCYNPVSPNTPGDVCVSTTGCDCSFSCLRPISGCLDNGNMTDSYISNQIDGELSLCGENSPENEGLPCFEGNVVNVINYQCGGDSSNLEYCETIYLTGSVLADSGYPLWDEALDPYTLNWNFDFIGNGQFDGYIGQGATNYNFDVNGNNLNESLINNVTNDIGTCTYFGCTDPAAINYSGQEITAETPWGNFYPCPEEACNILCECCVFPFDFVLRYDTINSVSGVQENGGIVSNGSTACQGSSFQRGCESGTISVGFLTNYDSSNPTADYVQPSSGIFTNTPEEGYHLYIRKPNVNESSFLKIILSGFNPTADAVDMFGPLQVYYPHNGTPGFNIYDSIIEFNATVDGQPLELETDYFKFSEACESEYDGSENCYFTIPIPNYIADGTNQENEDLFINVRITHPDDVNVSTQKTLHVKLVRNDYSPVSLALTNSDYGDNLTIDISDYDETTGALYQYTLTDPDGDPANISVSWEGGTSTPDDWISIETGSNPHNSNINPGQNHNLSIYLNELDLMFYDVTLTSVDTQSENYFYDTKGSKLPYYPIYCDNWDSCELRGDTESFELNVLNTSGPEGYVISNLVSSFGISPDTYELRAFGLDNRETVESNFSDLSYNNDNINGFLTKNAYNEIENPVGDFEDNVWKYEMYIVGPAPDTENFELYNDDHWDTLIYCSDTNQAYWGEGSMELCSNECEYGDCLQYIDHKTWQDWDLNYLCTEYGLEENCMLEAYRPPQQQYEDGGGWLPTYCGSQYSLLSECYPTANTPGSVSNLLNYGYNYTFSEKGNYRIYVKSYDLYYHSDDGAVGTKAGTTTYDLFVEYVIPIKQSISNYYLPWQGLNMPYRTVYGGGYQCIGTNSCDSFNSNDCETIEGCSWTLFQECTGNISCGELGEVSCNEIDDSYCTWYPGRCELSHNPCQVIPAAEAWQCSTSNLVIPGENECNEHCDQLYECDLGNNNKVYFEESGICEGYCSSECTEIVGGTCSAFGSDYSFGCDSNDTCDLNSPVCGGNINLSCGEMFLESGTCPSDCNYNEESSCTGIFQCSEHCIPGLCQEVYDSSPLTETQTHSKSTIENFNVDTRPILGVFSYNEDNNLNITWDTVVEAAYAGEFSRASENRTFEFLPDFDARTIITKKFDSDIDGRYATLFEYYDPEISPEFFYQTSAPTEVQLYGYLRRTGNLFESRDYYTFDALPSEADDAYIGFIDWGDGTDVEYNKEPIKLGNDTLIKHSYSKPGIYEITGYMFTTGLGSKWMNIQTEIDEAFSENHDCETECNLFGLDCGGYECISFPFSDYGITDLESEVGIPNRGIAYFRGDSGGYNMNYQCGEDFSSFFTEQSGVSDIFCCCSFQGVTSYKKFVIRISISNDPDQLEEFQQLGGGQFTYLPVGSTNRPTIGGSSKSSMYYKNIKRNLGYIGDTKMDIVWKSYNDKLNAEYALAHMDENFVGPEISKFTGSIALNEITDITPDSPILFYGDTENQVSASSAKGFFSGSVDEYGRLYYEEGETDVYMINSGLYKKHGELGKSAGYFDVSNARVYIESDFDMWKQLGFTDEETGNPVSPRYWNNIIPKDYDVINSRNEDVNSTQEWTGSNEYGNNYYYPVLPKFDEYYRFDETNMGLQGDKIPFGTPDRKWNEMDKEAAITNIYYTNRNMSMNMAAKEKDQDTSDDLSGNLVTGVLIGDYKVQYNDKKEPGKQQTIKKSKFKNEDKPF